MKRKENKLRINLPATQLSIVFKRLAAGIFMTGMIPPITRAETGAQDIFWTRQFGTAYNDFAHALIAGSSGIYIVGTTGGVLPGQTYSGMSDAYISRIGFIEASHAGRAVHMGGFVPLLLGND